MEFKLPSVQNLFCRVYVLMQKEKNVAKLSSNTHIVCVSDITTLSYIAHV